MELGLPVATDDERDLSDIEVVVESRLLCGSLGTEGHIDGSAGDARLLEPRGIVVDVWRHRVYVAELNSIRMVDLRDGRVSTLAGGVEEGDATDGSASAVAFNNLRGAALSHDGARLMVCDFWNHCVREVVLGPPANDPEEQAVVRTRCGGGVAFSKPGGLSTPNDVAFDRHGRLYIACGSGFDDDTIRSMSPEGAMRLEAGMVGSAGDMDGPCRRATFDSPQGIAVDDMGYNTRLGSAEWSTPDLYVADYCNHTIRKVTCGRVITIGGKAAVAGDADGDGSESRFTEPTAICLSSAPLAGSGERTIYVAEGCGRLRWLRRVSCCAAENESASHYLVGTLLGTPELWAPRGLTAVPDNSGDLLVADTGKCVVWQLCLRSAEKHRKVLARKRLAMSLALHLRAGLSSPCHVLSADLVESVCSLALLTPSLAAVLHSMPRPPQIDTNAAVDASPGLGSEPVPDEPVKGDEALRLAEEVSVAEAAKRALLARISTAEQLLVVAGHEQPIRDTDV